MERITSRFWLLAVGLVTLATASPAVAHIVSGTLASGFNAGFMHPWLGLDHLLAMVAVGLLAVRAESKRALLLIPAGFVFGMLLGGFAAYVALPVPSVELAIATSVIVLGLALAFLPRVQHCRWLVWSVSPASFTVTPTLPKCLGPSRVTSSGWFWPRRCYTL